ncbi:hypothetical protein HYH03_000038 [Edaphochlamys debaryana]|uniref:Uncharacterized protein n=1 Tax=Edaphochlamys debaryana TaxID=47281 RepID=A0A835YIG2_9CHLO|nr:hypothetical protein HYH03_000038 [Edaphochlamys debaryana]|eukprot:KAG2501531.1 hypothetical protein HYH03_000038 [Edaphochlamys debaryana]
MMLRAPAVSLAPARTQRCARPVLVRADPPQVRQTREFREGDSEVKRSDAGGVTQRPDGLYADLNAGQPRQKSNLSPEMKARLRKEYTGFGGSENTAMSSNYFLWISGIIATLAILSWLGGAL